MCGICGVVCEEAKLPVNITQIIAMRDSMTHRGPDDAGNYMGKGIALASRRLAILDLSERGHMPMSTPDGRYWIVYNGEVYNYRELRQGLAAKGYTFQSNTDTEVLLHLYAEYGPLMLDFLNGMFALAIWDSRERTLFLARDRLGIKPLYYTLRNGTLYFASEQKSLIAAGIPFEFDTDTWPELLFFRYVAGEKTPFVGIKRLLPGHYMIWRDGNVSIKRWWALAERARSQANELPENIEEWYRDTFDDAVALRRISDVPVGVLLSGGLDSSSVAASLALQSSETVSSFTVGFAESEYDESPLARDVAERWHLDFHQQRLSPEKLLLMLREASWYNDEPLVHGNDAHLLFISQYSKPRVTVLLSGEGADETLGGYVRYRPLHYAQYLGIGGYAPAALTELLLVATRFNYRLNKLLRFVSLGSVDDFVLFNACDVLPGEVPLSRDGLDVSNWPYREQVFAEARSLYPGDRVRQAMYVDQHTFLCSLLDRNDRMTMGASIECRVPFLDYRLVETLAALPTKSFISRAQGKQLLRSALGERLPDSVLRHRKWGFGVPWSKYLRENEEFTHLIQSLPQSDIIQSAPFDVVWLEGLIKNFMAGDDRGTILLRQLLMIQVWHDTYKQRSAMFSSV